MHSYKDDSVVLIFLVGVYLYYKYALHGNNLIIFIVRLYNYF